MKKRILSFLLTGTAILALTVPSTTANASEISDVSSTEEITTSVVEDIVVTDSIEAATEENAVTEIVTTTLDTYDVSTITTTDYEASINTYSTTDTYIVVLDPGHGRAGSGTYRDYGDFVIDEAVINFKISQYTKTALEENYDNIVVYMTKSSQNENPSVADRVALAETTTADLLVSQHVNSTGSETTTANGVLGIVPKVDESHAYNKDAALLSQKLARKILDQLVGLGFKDNDFLYKLSGDNTQYPDGSLADYYGIVRECRERNIPGTIIEHGFANNSNDAAKLRAEEMLKKIGEADARGIVEYLKEHAGYDDVKNDPPAPNPPVLVGPFTDVDPSMYYVDSILWAYNNHVTTGTTDSTFEPDASCTRGQVVTFLHRTLGEPTPTITDGPFADVSIDNPINYYYNAVLWAYENHITTGTTNSTFEPDKTVTRAEFVTFLWRVAGEPMPTTTTNPFIDIDPTAETTYYYNAVLWAVENGITTGTSTTEFSPDDPCTRGQVVTFLYRAYANE